VIRWIKQLDSGEVSSPYFLCGSSLLKSGNRRPPPLSVTKVDMNIDKRRKELLKKYGMFNTDPLIEDILNLEQEVEFLSSNVKLPLIKPVEMKFTKAPYLRVVKKEKE